MQRIAFSNSNQTYIDLPIYSPGTMTSTLETASVSEIDAFVYPNPATDQISVFLSKNGTYQLTVYNLQGQVVVTKSFRDQTNLTVAEWDAGLYIFRVTDKFRDRKSVV